jgi:hypothetical protein
MGLSDIAKTANPFAGIDVGNRAVPAFTGLGVDGGPGLAANNQVGSFLFYQRDGAPFRVFSTKPHAGIDAGDGSRLAFTDFDGDLVIGDNRDHVHAHPWLETSFRFTTANPLAAIDVGAWATPNFTDLDGDGGLDLITGRALSTSTLLAYFSLFAANPLAGLTFTTQTTPVFQDIDGDLDVVVGHSTFGSTPQLAALEKIVSGRQIVASDAFNGTSNSNLWALPSPALSGVNDDEKPELLVGESDGSLATYLYNAALAISSDAATSAATGNDVLFGGEGNDADVVGHLEDSILGLANEAYGLVVTSLSYSLGAALEWLSLTGAMDLGGSGGGLANLLDGNAGNSGLVGGPGNDSRDGKNWANLLAGGAGNDALLLLRGEAHGEALTDLAGNGSAAGNRLEVWGHGTAGQDASFVQIDSTTWGIMSRHDLTQDVFTFAHVPALHNSDWSFV